MCTLLQTTEGQSQFGYQLAECSNQMHADKTGKHESTRSGVTNEIRLKWYPPHLARVMNVMIHNLCCSASMQLAQTLHSGGHFNSATRPGGYVHFTSACACQDTLYVMSINHK